MQFIARKIDGELYIPIDQVYKAIEEKDAEIENIKAKLNTKPTKEVIAMACGGKKTGGKKPTKKKG